MIIIIVNTIEWAWTYRRPKTIGLYNDQMILHRLVKQNALSCQHLECRSSGAVFTIGRRYTPVLVFTVTALTNLSLPGWTLTTLAIGHLCGTTLSSRSTRTSPTSVFLVELCHLENRLRLTRYSEDQRCQKCRTIAWHRCQRRKRGID